MSTDARPRRWPLALALLALLACAWASIIVQFVFIQPFERQTPRGLAIGAFLRDAAPWITLACFIALVAASVALWRRTRWLGRAAIVLAGLIVLASVVVSRVNMFEMMFSPLPEPRFVQASAVA